MKKYGTLFIATRGTRRLLARWPSPRSFRASCYQPLRVALTVLAATTALPVAAYEPETNLGSLGSTENQQRTGDAVQIVCGQFASGQITPANSSEKDLFDRCRSMVHNANEILNLPGTADSLGLNQDDLGNVVMTVATEELSATKSMTTEMASGQTSVAITRLQAVRAGGRFGISGLTLNEFQGVAGLDPHQAGDARATGGAAGDPIAGDWGFFVNAKGGFGDRDGTANENEFDYDYVGFDVGADYRFNTNLIVGALVGYSTDDVDFANVSTSPGIPNIPGGEIQTDAWGLGVYGTYYDSNYYVDGLLGYTSADYNIDREILLPNANDPNKTVRRTAKGDTDSDAWTVSLGGGIDMENDKLSYGPYGRLTYQNTDVDGYTESGADGLNLKVSSQDWESFTSVIGGRASYAHSTGWGVLVPQLRLGWVHEFMNDSETITAVYKHDPGKNQLVAITDDPDRNYFELGVGLSAVIPGGTQLFLDYQTLLGHRYVNDHAVTLGLRGEF